MLNDGRKEFEHVVQSVVYAKPNYYLLVEGMNSVLAVYLQAELNGSQSKRTGCVLKWLPSTGYSERGYVKLSHVSSIVQSGAVNLKE